MLVRERIFEIEALLETHCRLIDEDRLEEWLDLFTEDARYEIVSRENVALGLPLPLMLCENKNMMRDRIVSLRNANIYNLHTDRHILSLPRIEMEDDGSYRVTANYSLFQTNPEGVTVLFSVGCYHDLVVRGETGLQFRSKKVITDTGAVLSLLATPI